MKYNCKNCNPIIERYMGVRSAVRGGELKCDPNDPNNIGIC